MKTFLLLLVILIALISCRHRQNHSVSQKDSILLAQKGKKSRIDKYVNSHGKSVITFVKVPGKNELLRVQNKQWPDEIEYTYNIYRDEPGKIIFIAETPFSESGDWAIVYKHYFDDEGNTFVFIEQQSIFDDEVKGGIVRELLVNYYGDSFKKLKQINKITDADYLPIKRSRGDFDFRDDEYDIYKNLNDCLKGYNIKLPL